MYLAASIIFSPNVEAQQKGERRAKIFSSSVARELSRIRGCQSNKMATTAKFKNWRPTKKIIIEILFAAEGKNEV
jgi:hypothetical protein